jgi:predicted ATP-dependent serine protease
MHFDPELFRNYMSGTVLDELLCSYKGLPKGVNYMIIGDPGVGKTTIILDLLSNIRSHNSGVRVLPEPAPATTRMRPSVVWAAARCSGFRDLRSMEFLGIYVYFYKHIPQNCQNLSV